MASVTPTLQAVEPERPRSAFDANGTLNATLAARAGVRGKVMTEEQRAVELQRHLHRVRFYHHGKHFVLNKRHSSMFLIPGESEGRMKLFRVIDSVTFTAIIALFIALNCVMTILDTPNIRELAGITTTVFAFDIVFQIVFTIEMAMKIAALGVAFHRHSFFRSPQNTIDFVVVGVGFAVFFFDQPETTQLMRLVRSCRAMGYLTRVALLRSIFVALIRSVRKLRDIMLLMSFVIVGMAVLGLQVFVGTFQQKCYFDVETGTPNVTTRILDPSVSDLRCSVNPDSGHECGAMGALCLKDNSIFRARYLTFDHIGDATLLVFKTVTMDNWPADLKVIQEANGISYFLYSFTIVLFGSFFAMNLVLAILSGEYEEVTQEQEEREKRDQETRERVLAEQGGTDEESMAISQLKEAAHQVTQLAMSEDQTAKAIEHEFDDEEEEEQEVGGEAAGKSKENDGAVAPQHDSAADGAAGADATSPSSPRRKAKEPRPCFTRFRRFLWKHMVGRAWFKNLSIVVTAINILVLATDHHGIDPTWDNVNDGINFACSLFFILEAVVKIVTMLDLYFRDPFNVFDLILCCISIPEMVLSGSGNGSSLSALRALRLARVMRVINSSPRVRQLLITVGNAAYESSFLFLFMFIFVGFSAVFCVIVFPDAVPADVRPNYVDFPNAVLTMFIIISGENWVDEALKVMLGTTTWAAAFFIPYFLFGNYVILNFVVVILIASYNNAAEQVVEEDDKQAMLEVAASQRRNRGDSLTGPSFSVREDDDDDDEYPPPPAQRRESDPDNTAANDDDLANPQSPHTLELAAEEADKADGSRSPTKETVHVTGDNSPTGEDGAAGDDDEEALAAADAEEKKKKQQRDFLPPPPDRAVSFSDDGAEGTEEQKKKRAADKAKKPLVDNGFDRDEALLEMKFRSFRRFSCRLCLADLFGMPRDPEEVFQRVEGRSLKVFAEDNIVRRFCARVVAHPYFELLVIVVVLQSCIAVGMDNNESRRADPEFGQLLDFNSYFMVFFFLIELIMKWIAFGVVIGEYAYFKDAWNRLDFFVLIVSILALFLPVQAVQALRVFRLASKWTSMRVVITSLVGAIPGIANVFFLVGFFLLVSGILGVQTLKGRFASCNDESIEERVLCVGNYTVTGTEVVGNNGTYTEVATSEVAQRYWNFAFYNFNNLGQAALALTVITYGDGWSGILYNAMDVRSVDLAMQPNASYYYGIFVVLLLVLGNFFLNNLFVGSLMDSFGAERKRATGAIDESGHALLSETQERWIREYRFALASKLPLLVPKPEFPVRRFFAWIYFADRNRLDARPVFDGIITFIILLNAIFLATTHDEQPDYWSDILAAMNIFFAVAFSVEFVVKIFAMRPHAYFDDAWNGFDFLILVAAWLGIVFAGVPGTNALRVLRVARVLRLVKKARGLYRLFQSLVYALPQLVNVSIFLFLILYVFGVTGTQLFQELYYDDSDDTILGRFFNFKAAWRSMMLLFQIGTGEAWADVLAAARITPENSPCTDAKGDCGTLWAYPFFILFMLCANSVAVNLFIYIVVDNYMEVNLIADRMSQYLLHRISRFRRLWVAVDGDRTGHMRWESFVMCVRQMQLTAGEEWDEFMEDWGEDEIQDLDGDGREDESASDVSDDDGPTTPVDIRPTTADLRNGGVMRVLARAMGKEDFDATRIAAGKFETAIRGPRLAELSDTFFLQKIKRMAVPVGDEGIVFYEDCLYGIVREFYAVDDAPVSLEAATFLSSMVDYEPNAVFMVHHALATIKICRAFRGHQKREFEKSMSIARPPPAVAAAKQDSSSAPAPAPPAEPAVESIAVEGANLEVASHSGRHSDRDAISEVPSDLAAAEGSQPPQRPQD